MKSSVMMAVLCAVAMAAGATDEAWLLQTNLLERATAGRRELPNVLILGDSISM